MNKILLMLVASLICTQLLAVDDVENLSSGDTKVTKGKDVNLKGSSQDLGYHVKFADNKDADFHLWGLARMYFYPASPDTKMVMPYFRFNLDAKKDKNWSLHARLDYGKNIKGEYYKLNNDSPDDSLNGGSTFYYSRAFVKFTDGNLQYSAGRILNQAVKYDVLDKYTAFDDEPNRSNILGLSKRWTDSSYHSGEGFRAHYDNGSVEAEATITYSNGDSASDSNKGEKFFYSAFVDHKLALANDMRFEYGAGASTTSHDDVNPTFIELLPHAGFFCKNFYIIDQFMVRDMVSLQDSGVKGRVSEFHTLFRNHLEVGKTLNLYSKDVTFDAYLASVAYDSDNIHDLGVEAKVDLNQKFSVLVNTQYDNISESDIEKEDQHEGLRRLSYYAYVNYLF